MRKDPFIHTCIFGKPFQQFKTSYTEQCECNHGCKTGQIRLNYIVQGGIRFISKKNQPLNSVVLRLASKPVSLRIRLERFRYIDWNHGRRKGGAGGPCPSWILKLLAKMVVFSILRGKNKFHHFWPPPGKNLSDAHDWNERRNFVATAKN